LDIGAVLPVPSDVPAGAKKVEVNLTFDYAFIQTRLNYRNKARKHIPFREL